MAIQADSGDAGAIKSAVAQTVESFGGLDILVNNAGLAVVAEFSLEDFRSHGRRQRAQAFYRHSGGRPAHGFIHGLTRDLGPRGMTVNNVQPGPLDTDMNPADGPFASHVKGMIAVQRYGRADEIAAMVAFLAGPEAAYINRASLRVDGALAA